MEYLNDKPFSYQSHYGTYFSSNKCSLDEVLVTGVPSNLEWYSKDLAEMISYHALNIWPNLNGFQGYDCISFKFV